MRERSDPMKSRYVVCFFFMCMIFLFAFQISYQNSLQRKKLQLELTSFEETPSYVAVQAGKELFVTTDMTYFFETYNQNTQALSEEILSIPVELLGKTREEVAEFLEEEGTKLSLTEADFVSLELMTFSDTHLIVRKVISGVIPPGYYLGEKDGYLVVYEGDKSTIFMHTNIALTELTTEEQAALKTGIFLESDDEIYDYLENCTS